MSLGIEEDNKKTDEPDIDIHIIPDAVQTRPYRKRPLAWYLEKPSAKDLRQFSFRSTPCSIFGFSSQNRDLTSLRSFYLFCLPQGRYRKCESRYATNGPKRKNRFQATLKRFSLSFLRLRRFRSFEPKPRFELGTPSLRVKCSTAELFRRFISEFGCKDSTFYYFFAIFARNFYRRC